jgi:hypothetical protein
MLMVFEVYFAADADVNSLLSDEVKRETHAQMMTFEEASKVGFGGLPKPSVDGEARLIAVNAREGKWIHRVLETSNIVSGFRVHEVDG